MEGREVLAWVQGGYFLVTGVWPLVSMETFEQVTGPKVDRWLVKAVGVTVAAIGLALLVAAREGVPVSAVVLAVGSALGLGAIDVVYALRGVISKVYLADAALEGLLVGAWLVVATAR